MHFSRSLIACWLTIVAISPMASSCFGQNTEIANRKALAYFANAADYQNAGAFELAAEEWEKLVKEFPADAQASTAWHHLGICNLQRKEPNPRRAIEAFREALKDPKLEQREESLINLGWALFSEASRRDAGSEEQKRELAEARSRLNEFLKEYSDGAYLDQAVFYLGEIENLMGNRRKAIDCFKQFTEKKKLELSPLRPEALYGLAVAMEEEKQQAEAERSYLDFLSKYKEHRLVNEVRVRYAELLIKNEKWTEAESVLTQASTAKDAPLADLILLRRATLASKIGKNTEASRAYSELTVNFPESEHAAPAMYALGLIELQTGKTDEAIAHFAALSRTNRSNAIDAILQLAKIHQQQGQLAEAMELLEGALGRFEKDSRLSTAIRMEMAELLESIPGRTDEARQLYERIANDSPESPLAPRAAYNAAFSALENGQDQKAQQWAERFLSRYPNDPLRAEVSAIAAESLLRQGQHASAARAFGKLIDAGPRNENVPLWKLRQGMALYLDGKYSQAVQNMSMLVPQLSKTDQKAEAQFIAGASYLYQEQLAPAIRDLEASYKTDSHWSNADEVLLLLGEAYQRDKNTTAAKRTYERLLVEHPTSRFKAQVQYKLAQLAASEGKFSDAVKQYKTIAADPAAASFHNFALYGAAWCLMQQNAYEAAYNELQPLLKKNLQDSIGSEAMLAEGVCLRNIGKSDQAISALRRFLDRKPSGVSLANGLYELGLALANIKKWTEAGNAFERIVKEVPEYPAMDKVLFELGWNLIDQEKPADAAKQFAQLFKNYPTSRFAAESRYMVAQHLYDAGKYAEATDGYQKVVSQTSDAELHEKSLYKLGWSHFQLEQYEPAAKAFEQQAAKFSDGPLAIDGMFMQAECDFKLERFKTAFEGFQRARKALESTRATDAVSAQVKTLIYLHGGQCLRELKQWDECEQWLRVVIEKHVGSPYLPTALYELGNCKQNQGKTDEAITHYTEVADNYRNEVAARARFMLGEIYFARKDFVKAIPEFQRVMYGFGGEKAPEEIKKWQAKSAFEAARCSEALIQSLNGSARKKVVETTIEFYEYVVDKRDSSAELASQAQARLGELQKLR